MGVLRGNGADFKPTAATAATGDGTAVPTAPSAAAAFGARSAGCQAASTGPPKRYVMCHHVCTHHEGCTMEVGHQ